MTSKNDSYCYGIIEPTFWTRGSGRLLRGKPVAQAVCLYLFSAPLATMLGLYYMPIPTICHDVGCTARQARDALKAIKDADIATYDDETETVFVHTMAVRRLQLKDQIKVGDKRAIHARRLYRQIPETPLREVFLQRYGEQLRLLEDSGESGDASKAAHPGKGLPPKSEGASPKTGSPIEGASTQDQGQGQGQQQDQQQNQHLVASGGPGSVEPDPNSTPSPTPTKTEKGKGGRKPGKTKVEKTDADYPGYQEVVDVWFEEFKRVKGTKPPFNSREGKFIHDLFDKVGDAEAVKNVIRAAFEQRWWVQHKASLRDLSDNPNPFMGQLPAQTTPELPFGRTSAPRVQRGIEYEPKTDPDRLAALESNRDGATF